MNNYHLCYRPKPCTLWYYELDGDLYLDTLVTGRVKIEPDFVRGFDFLPRKAHQIVVELTPLERALRIVFGEVEKKGFQITRGGGRHANGTPYICI